MTKTRIKEIWQAQEHELNKNMKIDKTSWNNHFKQEQDLGKGKKLEKKQNKKLPKTVRTVFVKCVSVTN